MVFADHFYTTDPTGELALQQGYQYLGIACYVFNTQVEDSIPVYRSFKPWTGDHFYFISRTEFDHSVKHGYRAEHIAWFMFGGRQIGSIALNRYYNPDTTDHMYCTDDNTNKVADFGMYRAEGAAGYVLDDSKYTQDDIRVVPLYWWYYKGSEEPGRKGGRRRWTNDWWTPNTQTILR